MATRRKQETHFITPPAKATLKDVAERCGVSPMTVSRLLNNQGLVAKNTAAKIRKAMRTLNYTPNLLAKGLRLSRTGTFGMMISDGTYLLLGRMVQSAFAAATEAGYSILTANTNRRPELERGAINLLLDRRVDGILLCAPFNYAKKEIERIRKQGVPVVVVMRHGDFPADCVITDNYRGGYEVVQYLAGKGIDDISFFNLPDRNPNGRERWRGNRQAMLDNRLPIRTDRVLQVPRGTDSGYAALRGLIDRGVRRGAFVCGCDTVAVGAIKAALDAGISVPGEMQFCGFDDIDLLDYLNVPLTTMRQHVEEMGREAVRLLLETQKERRGAHEPTTVRLPCELVARASA